MTALAEAGRSDPKVLAADVTPERGDSLDPELQRQRRDVHLRSGDSGHHLVQGLLPLRPLQSLGSRGQVPSDDEHRGGMLAVLGDRAAALAAIGVTAPERELAR